jgi:hypothetical protein
MKIRKLVALLMLVIFLTSCAAWMPQDYNARYDAATRHFQATGEEPSSLESDILSAKYTFLMTAWQPIAILDGYAATNEIPPVGLEDEINGLIGLLEAQLKEGS